jgi:hypothetical protein
LVVALMRGRATQSVEDVLPVAASGGLALPHTDWLYHHFRITGEPAEVAALRAAAAGAGVIPWTHDLGPAAEDWFHLLAVPPAPQRRSLSLEGARILAGQLRDTAEARQRLARAIEFVAYRTKLTLGTPHAVRATSRRSTWSRRPALPRASLKSANDLPASFTLSHVPASRDPNRRSRRKLPTSRHASAPKPIDPFA